MPESSRSMMIYLLLGQSQCMLKSPKAIHSFMESLLNIYMSGNFLDSDGTELKQVEFSVYGNLCIGNPYFTKQTI